MSTAIEQINVRAQVRSGSLAPSLAAARKAESEAFVEQERAAVAAREALASYDGGAGDASEAARLRARRLASAAASSHGRLAEARAEVDRELAHVRAADHAIAQQVLDLHDPALVKRAAATTALDMISQATAAAWARGEVQLEDVRLWLAGVAGHRGACAELRASGGKARDVAWGLFLLPVLEQLAARDIAVVTDPFIADAIPPEGKPLAIKAWFERSAELTPSAPHARNLSARLAQIRGYVEQRGARDSSDVVAIERPAPPSNFAPPPPIDPRLNEGNATHYPWGMSPEGNLPQPLADLRERSEPAPSRGRSGR